MSTVIEIPPHELPDWMRQAQRGIDWGVVLAFAFSLIIAMPFIIQVNLPHTNASENYVYRSADYATAIQEGRLYPRWSANALGGYGAPIPHYYPPGAGYLPALIEVLFTNDTILAVRLVYIIALGMAGSITYVFVRRRTDAAAGLLAGVLYVYSPYIGLTAPHILGDLPGVMTFALMPMLLWSVDRLLMRNRPLDIMLLAFATSGLYLTSIRAALLSTMLVIIFILWHWISTHRRRIRLRLIAISYAIGIGIASFYWIPALLEHDSVQWRAPVIPSELTLSLAELFSPLRQIDTGAIIHWPQFTLGITGAGFAIAGVIGLLRFRSTTHFERLFLGIGFGLAIFAVVAMSKEVWLMGAIALCIAIGSSTTTRWQAQLPARWQRLLLPSLVILVWITSAPVWLPPPVTESFGNTDALAQVHHEQQGYGTAVVPIDKPIPATVPEHIPFDRFLLDGYQTGNINKIPPAQYTPNAQAGLLDHNSHSDRFQLRANTQITLNVLTAYFPGWRATVSERPVPLMRNPETGLMWVDIPALVSGEFLLVLGSTPIRTASWIISWDMVLISILLTWGRTRRLHNTFDDLDLFGNQQIRLLVVVLATCGLVVFLFNYASFPLSLRQRSGYALANSTFTQNRTDTGLSLLAFRLAQNQYTPGEEVKLTLYWQAQRFLSDNYRVRLSIVNNQESVVWVQTQLRHPGNYPTRRWKTGLYVTDPYTIHLPTHITPGNYQINVEMNNCNPDCANGSQVTFFNENGAIVGTNLTLPTLINVLG